MDKQHPTMDQQNKLTDIRASAEKVLVLKIMVAMYVISVQYLSGGSTCGSVSR
jgi:hypothetical protein